MKKLLSAAAMVMVIAGSAVAQGGGGGGGMQMTPEQMQAMMTRQVDMMFKDITITDAVKAKAGEVISKAQMDMRGIDRSAADAQEKRGAILKKRNDDLAALLTNDADKAKLAANIAAMPQRGGRPAPPPPPPAL